MNLREKEKTLEYLERAYAERSSYLSVIGIERAVGPAPAFIGGSPKALPSGGPTQDDLNAAFRSTRDWLYQTHDYSGSQFVAADQINTSNASQLRAVCAFQMGDLSNFQTGPIVYNGTMFATTTHDTVALDATNCRPKWRYTWQPRAREVWLTNRGVAIKGGRLVRGTSNGYLVELNTIQISNAKATLCYLRNA
jgi:alcohol dehydrogenase (cytochrome c)